MDEKLFYSSLRELTILSLEYPDDLYNCIYYLFAVPPPATILPIERSLMDFNKKQIIFIFGEKDWMERYGVYRLNHHNPNLYKIFSIKNSGHSSALERPKEVSEIIGQYFEQ